MGVTDNSNASNGEPPGESVELEDIDVTDGPREGIGQTYNAWVKVFRIFPEFRILRLTFHRKPASNAEFYR